MAIDNSRDWIVETTKIAQRQSVAPPVSREEIAARLVELHELMLSAPGAVDTAYGLLHERDLSTASDARADQFYEEQWAWDPTELPDLTKATMMVASELRALDRHLADDGRQRQGSPMESAIAVGGKWTLLSRGSQRRRQKDRGQGKPYTRRGLLNHRLVPSSVRGYPVRLIELDDASSEVTALAAALAEGLDHKIEQADGRFAVEGIHFPNGTAVAAAQLNEAAEKSCWAMSWPELTIAPELRAEIAEILADWPFNRPKPPAIVVAGSCHETIQERRVNRARILNSRGHTVGHHEKIIPFFDSVHGVEDITAGSEITLLVTRGPLVAVGICKDFCDLSQDGIYQELDVDLVIVPSMGQISTAQGHATAAKMLRTRTGTAAFIVQQAEPGAKCKSNYVLAPDRDLVAEACELKEAFWSVHQWA